MKCRYCGSSTETFTSLDEPICYACAEKRNFPLCTDLGKYIADETFTCDFVCDDCIYGGADV